MSLTLEYESPSGLTVEFGWDDAAEYFILRADGMLSTRISPITARAPAQLGTTLVDVSADGRTIALSLWITGATEAATWQLREDLAAALFVPPSTDGSAPQLGTLRVVRDGLPTRQIRCIPVDSPQDDIMGERIVAADIELYAPYPYWSNVDEDSESAVASGGFEFPLEFPEEFEYYRVEDNVVNMGTIPASVTIRLDGEMDTPTITNETTGLSIQVNRTIADGEYVIIETGYGAKSVTLYPGAINIIDDVDLTVSDFWLLAAGSNTIVTSALAFGDNAETTITWTERWAGI